MKKTCIAIIFTLFAASSVFADISKVMPIETEAVLQQPYAMMYGTVSLEKNYNLTVKSDKNIASIHTENAIIIRSSDGTKVRSQDLKSGQHVAYVVKNEKQLLSPAVYNATAIVLLDDEKNVKTSYFDEDLISTDPLLENRLVLNVKDTKGLVTETSKAPIAKKELANQSLLIIYDAIAYSNPPQTTPDFIVLLPSVNNLTFEKPKKIYILREIADAMNYQLEWHPHTRTITMKGKKHLISFLADSPHWILDKKEIQAQTPVFINENNLTIVDESVYNILKNLKK